MLRSESLDEEPLLEAARPDVPREAAARPDVPRDADAPRDDALRDLLEPDDLLARVDFDDVEPALRLARPAPVDAALAEPPLRLLLALLPVVFRLVCFRELLVVATSPPFPGLMSRYPVVWVR